MNNTRTNTMLSNVKTAVLLRKKPLYLKYYHVFCYSIGYIKLDFIIKKIENIIAQFACMYHKS